MDITVKRRKVDPIESITITFTPDQFKALLAVTTRHITVAEALKAAGSPHEQVWLNSHLSDIWYGIPLDLKQEVLK